MLVNVCNLLYSLHMSRQFEFCAGAISLDLVDTVARARIGAS